MRRKKGFYISTGLLVLILGISLVALNNSTRLRATLDAGGDGVIERGRLVDDVDSAYSGPCRPRDWQCDSWQINCDQQLTQKRKCEKVNNCKGGIEPLQQKACFHLGNPQKNSVFSSCDSPVRALRGESLTIKGITSSQNGQAIKNAYVWLTDSNNSRLYLETLSDENGIFEVVVGNEALNNLEGKTAHLHIAPVEDGYGGNVGSASSTPQCASFADRSSDADTSININGEEISLVQSATFAEKVVKIDIPAKAKGEVIDREISIPLLEDPEGIRYRVLQ